jgi:CheY-like chemotaxis protein
MSTTIPHILMVDDDPIILKVLTHFLSEEGYETTAVESGKEALMLLETHPDRFSAIILDRMMPEFSGMDVLHKIYLLPVVKDIPVIMLTSHAEREDVGAAVIAGVFDFLFKPIDKELLLLVIKRALREKNNKSAPA